MIQEAARNLRSRWLEHYGFSEEEVRTDKNGQYILVEYGTEPFSDEPYHSYKKYVDLDEVENF